MSGANDDKSSKTPAASNNEEDLISGMLSQQKIEDISKFGSYVELIKIDKYRYQNPREK